MTLDFGRFPGTFTLNTMFGSKDKVLFIFDKTVTPWEGEFANHSLYWF